MRSGGWKPFWAALFASLLVLVPLVGGTVLLSRQQLRTQLRQAARSESGVPIQLPKTTDQLTVLLCVSGEQPGFVLAYLNASQNCVHLLSVPAVLTVPFAEEETSLARCYAAAGPARCREALAQVLALPEGTRFQVLAPVVRGKKGEHVKLLADARKSGFSRVRVDGILYDLSEEITLEKNKKHTIELVVDRLVLRGDLTRRLDEVQHDYTDEIVSTMHVHLDHHNCLEILALKGRGERVYELADRLLGLRGVKHGELTCAATGQSLGL